MIKVITYGTYDLFHYGHQRLLERAKALGDYLIVGVTADGFDLTRGKINNQQSLMERIESVRATGLADEIIVEEYEGQKIDDIQRYGVDIFTVGSDWEGKFDYLNEYCKVVYLPRTQGVSSTELRAEKRELKIGLVGESVHLIKFAKECSFVNGVMIHGICATDLTTVTRDLGKLSVATTDFNKLLASVDAVYLLSHPTKHYTQIKEALLNKKHVLCESPIALSLKECQELYSLAEKQGCVLMEAIKTAYATAYYRLILLVKSGRIGKPIYVTSTCTSMRFFNPNDDKSLETDWNSICSWGPAALLPVFQIMGTSYLNREIITCFANKEKKYDKFTKVNFLYKDAVASILVAKGVKAEGELVISGTKGYVYVPAPWWKTEYFEIRYENQSENRKYYYQLDGEGIRYEIVTFLKAISSRIPNQYITKDVSCAIATIMETFYSNNYIEFE